MAVAKNTPTATYLNKIGKIQSADSTVVGCKA